MSLEQLQSILLNDTVIINRDQPAIAEVDNIEVDAVVGKINKGVIDNPVIVGVASGFISF